MRPGCRHRTALLSAALLAVVSAGGLPAAAAADDAGVARCGSRKVAAIGRGCRDLLRAEARFLRNGDGAARAARVAAVGDRLTVEWSRAEAAAADARCAARSADADAAAARLTAAVSAATAALPGSVACRRALVALWAPLCRSAAASERAALRGAASAASAHLRARIAARWPAPGCAGGLDADAASRIILRLAAGAAADATTRGLRAVGADIGVAVGAAIEPDEVATDADYAPALAHDIGSLTAENAMKWGVVHPQPATWNWGPADAVVARAEAAGQRVRGHTLIWGALQLPAYVSGATTADELRGYMAEHIAGLVGRYAGRVAQWDVVNEPLPGFLDAPTPDGLDDNIFHQRLGADYIAEALHLARAADPSAQLYINENGLEVPGAKQDRFFALVQALLAAGAPLDGIGFQAHLGLVPPGQYPDAATIETSLRRFADLGLDVELTEVDVTLLFASGALPARFAQQAEDYRALGDACAAVPRCRGITMWGLNDQYSWLRPFLGNTDWPLPFDETWRRKPAYFGLRAGLLYGRLGVHRGGD